MSTMQNTPQGRPQALALLVESYASWWGCWAIFQGSPEELVKAGLVEQAWLAADNFGPSRTRSHFDQYGNRFTICKRGGGRFSVEIHTFAAEERFDDLDSKRVRKLKWFRDHGAELDAAVAAALARVCAPRKVRS